MSLTATLIAKIAGIDMATARRVLGTARAQDLPLAAAVGKRAEAGRLALTRPGAGLPDEFQRGRKAMAYAMALLIVRKPLHFYLGLTGLLIFPVYIAFQMPGWFHAT